MPLPPPHHIVILGAGFAGLRTGLELLKRRARLGNTTITLVDANAEHVYTPLLYEVAMGCVDADEETAICTLERGAALAYAENPFLHRKDGRLKFVRANVAGVDWETRTVKLEGAGDLPFNDLVLAVGGETATYGVPGVTEYAAAMKTLANAMHIRSRLTGALQKLRDGKCVCLDVVVIGGGPNGCEGAAELASYLRRLVREGKIPTGCFSVTLLEAGPEVLSMFSPAMRTLALRRLALLGVKVKTSVRVEEIQTDRVLTKDGDMHADLIVWAGGMKPRASVKAWGFPVDEKGFVLADSTFVVKGKDHAWALGDAAYLTHPVTGARVPALAQAAAKQATVLAENITRTLERKPTVTYTAPTRWNVVVPIGGAWAIADLGFMRVTGFLGYVARKAADLMYFLSILPPKNAFLFWMRGARAFLRND